MNLSTRGIRSELRRTNSVSSKLITRVSINILKVFLVTLLFAAALFISAGLGMINSLIDTAPEITPIDVSPMGFATTIYDADGNVVETLVTAGSNREAVAYEKIPQNLIDAFVAIEDERFWTHKGVDVEGILRAVYIGLTSSFSEGASTITQQLIKNNVFNGGREPNFGKRIERKVHEQILAMRLEEIMSKEEILENYLNTINLGSNCLGVQAAAKRYFDKDVSDLTLSECAVIAGITQNPYGYNPIRFPKKNAEKRSIVLDYMEEQGYITAEEHAEALQDDVYTRIEAVNTIVKEDVAPYSYFTDELIEQVLQDLQEEAGYSETQAHNLLYSGGLKIYGTQDPAIQAVVDQEISDPANYEVVDNKFSFTYSLAVTHGDNTSQRYTDSDIRVFLNQSRLEFDTQEEIDRVIQEFKNATLVSSDTVLSEYIDVTLQPQASMVIMDHTTGQVLALAGGRGEKTTSLSLNRATYTPRQPGSTFKVLAAFAPAINEKGATLATVYYDEEYAVGEKSISNWWGNNYLGYCNIREGIVYSMNVVATKCLMDTVTPKLGFDYCRGNFGITTLVDSAYRSDGTRLTDISAALALGGLTRGVTNLELTAAFASIANEGTYIKPIFYTQVVDHNGVVILDHTTPVTHEAVKPSTAFLLTDAMRESIEGNDIPCRLTPSSPAAKLDRMPAAGKSGTTTDGVDLWFVGYTPYYTCGIWTGFDDHSKIETEDNNYHKVIWKKVMDRIHKRKAVKAFPIPDDIVQVPVCAKSGLLCADGICNYDPRGSMKYTEYFLEGTEPETYCDKHERIKICKSELPDGTTSIGIPGPYCPAETITSQVYMRLEAEDTYSDDMNYVFPWRLRNTTCEVHAEPPTEPETETEEESGEAAETTAPPPESSGE